MLLVQSIIVYTLFAFSLWKISLSIGNSEIPLTTGRNLSIPNQYWWCIIIFCIVSGLRWDVGVDHISYVEDYIDMCDGRFFVRDRGMEPAFLLISTIFASLDIHYIFYIAFLAFLEIYFVIRAFKDERQIMPYILVLIVLGGYYFSWMNGIRQNIVACAFLFFFSLIQERKLLKYILCVGIAYTMHTSALLLLPLYLFAYEKHTWNRTWINMSIFLICFILGQTPFFVARLNALSGIMSFIGYDYYSDILSDLTDNSSFRSFSFGPRMLVNLITYVICILLYGKTSNYYRSEKFDFIFKMFLIGVCWYYLFINTKGIFLRPNYYFIIFALPVTAYTLSYLYKTRSSCLYAFLLICSLSFNFLSCYSDYHEPDLSMRRSQLYQFCFDHWDGK